MRFICCVTSGESMTRRASARPGSVRPVGRLAPGDDAMQDRSQIVGGDHAAVRRVDGRRTGVEQDSPACEHLVHVERHVGQLGPRDAEGCGGPARRRRRRRCRRRAAARCRPCCDRACRRCVREGRTRRAARRRRAAITRADSAQPEARQRGAGEELVELGVRVESRRDENATGGDRSRVLGVGDDLEPGHLVEDLREPAEVVGVSVGDDREPDLAGVAPDLADLAENRTAVAHHAGVDQVEPLVGLDEVAVGGDTLDAVDFHAPLGATRVPTGAGPRQTTAPGGPATCERRASRSSSARLRSTPQR